MYHPSINQCIINQSISETSINQYLQLLIGSCWSAASNQVKKERIELKIMKPNLERMQIAKELKSNFSKPNHKDINTVNSNKKVKTKPKTITKLSKTKHNKFKPNHKAKPKPKRIIKQTLCTFGIPPSPNVHFDGLSGWMFFPPKPNRTIKKNKTTNKT